MNNILLVTVHVDTDRQEFKLLFKFLLLNRITWSALSKFNENLRKYALFSKFYLFVFIFYFLATLGLHCCSQAFSSCGERGLLFVAVCGLLTVVTSLVVEHRL